jgi:arsenate reductase-like glutaredoxin family protein
VKLKVDARKTRLGPSDLKPILAGVKAVLASNGRTLRRFDLEAKDHDRTELLAAMIGPTGNLRAPTMRRGKMLVVGYHADSLKELVS